MMDLQPKDSSGNGLLGGGMMRPDRSFRFENGKLVVESDVAAGITQYGPGGADIWPEVVVTPAPAPTGKIPDSLYAYGQFGGTWSFGCRYQPTRVPVCSLYNPDGQPGNPSLFGTPAGRVWEMSNFEEVGTTNFGGYPDNGGPLDKAWRTCNGTDPDINCRDRFRMELTKTSVTIYVNGVKYFEQTGLKVPFPDALVNGNVYVYFAGWEVRQTAETIRFHWDHLAINPAGGPTSAPPPPPVPSPTPSGTPVTPTPTPTPTGVQQSPTPTPTPTSTPTSTPTPTARPTPTPTTAPTPTPTTTPTPTDTPGTGPGPEDVQVRSTSTTTSGTRVRRPQDVKAGDLLMANLEVDADPVTVSGPSGWKLLMDTPAGAGTTHPFHAQVWYKVAGAHEPATYRWTVPKGVYTDIGLVAFKNVNTSFPIDAFSGRDAGVTGRPQTDSVTTTHNRDLVVAVFVGFDYGDWTAAPGMNSLYEYDSNVAEAAIQDHSGPTGARYSQSSTSTASSAQIVALRAK
jgi:hypothetical protein